MIVELIVVHLKGCEQEKYASRKGAHIKFADECFKSDGCVAKQRELTEPAVVTTVLELHANFMMTVRVHRQFKGNDRGIVDCELGVSWWCRIHIVSTLTDTGDVWII